MARQVVDATLDLLEQAGGVCVIKGKGTTEHGIQYDTAAPYIYFGAAAGVQIARDNLQEQQLSLTTVASDVLLLQMHAFTTYQHPSI